MSNRKRSNTEADNAALGSSKLLCKGSGSTNDLKPSKCSNFILTKTVFNTSKMSNVEYLETPIKSDSDKKDYRYIKLPNGLKALLVHDPKLEKDPNEEPPIRDVNDIESAETDSTADSNDEEDASEDESSSEDGDSSTNLAACGLLIDVGSFSDPPDIQGLSHFLEHMIFMGSEKYPKENEYDSFINTYNGNDNAFTDSEETVFYFDIAPEQLDGALDRFGALFVAPLMHREAMVREREAVDSEFKMRLQDDSARREQLMCSYGSDGHPSKIFAWGNLQTLKHNLDDDALYQRVHEYRLRHYSANRMNLYLQSGHTLDELEQLVVKYFSEVQNNNLPRDFFEEKTWKNAFKNEFYENVFYMKPATDINRMDLTWCLPPLLEDYRVKTESVVEYILGHEAVGSLGSYLRKKLWVKDMEVGIGSTGIDSNRIFTLFEMTFYLTTLGSEHTDEILSATFAYLRLLQSCKDLKVYFDELQLIADNNFRFRAEKTSSEYAEDTPITMKIYSPPDLLTGNILLFEFNEEKIREMINQLNELPFNIMITKKSFEGIEFDQTESWFGTSYTTRPISDNWKTIFKSPPVIPELSLPEKNNFITTNFDLIYNENPEMYPQRIFIDGISETHELWYKQDDKFGLPKAILSFYLFSPLPLMDPKCSVTLGLFSHLMRHHLTEILYPASCADLHFQVFGSDRGLVFKVSGFNQRLPLIVDIITKQMRTLMDNIKEDEFNMYKEQQRRQISNRLTDPSTLNKNLRLWTIQKNAWPEFVYHEIIKNTTIADLEELHQQFFKSLKISGLIQGNIAKSTAIEVMQNVVNNLNCSPVDDTSVLSIVSLKLPVGEHFLQVKGFNPNDCNSLITNYYQIGPINLKLDVTLDLMIVIAQEPVFDILRSKEQLGYVVSISIRNTNNILGYQISVQSQEDKHNSSYVEQRIENFRQELQKIITEMENEEFENLRDSLIVSRMIADTELADEFNRNFAEIIKSEYYFDRKKREIEIIKTLTKQDVLDALQVTLNKSTMKKLSIQVIGNIRGNMSENIESERIESINEEDRVFVPVFMNTMPEGVDGNVITDIEEFRRTLVPYDDIKLKI